MSALLYHITVTDGHGRVLEEQTHTSLPMIVGELPRMKKRSEDKLKKVSQNTTKKERPVFEPIEPIATL